VEEHPLEKSAVEKFAAADLSPLREELMQSGLDSWQAAELIGTFLNMVFPTMRHAVRRHALNRLAAR